MEYYRVMIIIVSALITVSTTTELNDVVITRVSDEKVEVAEGTQEVTIKARVSPLGADDLDIKWSLVAGYSVNVMDNPYRAFFNTTWDSLTGETALIIKNIQISHDGEYRLQVRVKRSDGSYSAVSDSPAFTIVVMVPPKSIDITGGPSHTVTENVDYNLTCIARESNPAVTMTWLVDNVPIATAFATTAIRNTDDVERNYYYTEKTMTLKPAAGDTGKTYTCKVEGKQLIEAVIRQTSITVQYMPKVTIAITPNSLVHREKTDVSFTCSSDAFPKAVSWKWFLDGAEMAGETSDTVTFSSIQLDKNGKKLKCEATNTIGSGHIEQTLTVHYAPRFTTKADNVEVDLGDSVTFTCEIDGNPSPNIIWMKEGERQILGSSPTLTISSVRERDIAAYQCVGTVTGFDNAVHTAYILKKDVPKISGPTDFTFSQGQTAVISCKVACVPEPTELIWRKGRNGAIVDTSAASRYSIHRENNVHGLTTILTIHDLASNDFDDYNCTIKNERGMDSMIVTLSQTDDFPWLWVLVGAGALVVLVISITVAVCCCRRNKAKTSSADSNASDPYWMEPHNARPSPFRGDGLQFYQNCSLSVVSNTTDSSTKKPADGMENIEVSSLPEYGARPIDTWRTSQDHNNTHVGFDSLDYPNPSDPKPELYGTFRAQPVSGTFDPQIAYPPGNYGSYRVQQPRHGASPVPQYSTLPLRPSMLPPNEYNRFGYNSPEHHAVDDDGFPEPPPEHRLATNV